MTTLTEKSKLISIKYLEKHIFELSKEIEYAEKKLKKLNSRLEKYKSELNLEIKVGNVLIAIDACTLDEYPNPDALLIGEEYTVFNVFLGDDNQYWFSIKSEEFDIHDFPISEYQGYFKLKK